jgi:hypothetical protein
MFFQQTRIDAAGRTNGNDLRARCPLAPLLLHGNVHASTDHPQHRSTLWRLGAVDHAFRTVNTPGQLSQCFPQRFQPQRLILSRSSRC